VTRTDSGAAGGGYAGDSLEVVGDFDVLEAGGGEKRFDVGLLAEAEFEDEIAAGDEGSMSGRDEAAVDFEAVVAAEEGDVGFVLADFDGDKRAVGVGNVGWVGGDDFESLARDGGEEVALKEADVAGDVVAGSVLASDGEGGVGDVDGGEGRVTKLSSKGNDDGAGAGADVEDSAV